MLVRLGYVAMSVHLKNASPSQTMTYAQFQRIDDREAAIRKLERIANSNLENCLRLNGVLASYISPSSQPPNLSCRCAAKWATLATK